jgi:hypothetical protein
MVPRRLALRFEGVVFFFALLHTEGVVGSYECGFWLWKRVVNASSCVLEVASITYDTPGQFIQHPAGIGGVA